MTDKEQRLNTLARRFPTDKSEHGYLKYYGQHLPDKCRSMLEIGVAKGASALVWDSFYGKDELDLFLMDLYLDPDHVSPRWVRNNGWTPIIGDQGSLDDLSKIKEQFEVIVEDGSHNSHHQIISFKHLFLNNLRFGGQYYVEDCHCCKDPFYYGGAVVNFSDTILWMFKEFCNTGKILNVYFNEGESKVFESLIGSVKIFDEKLILITRK